MAAFQVIESADKKRHVLMNDNNNETMESIYKDETVHFYSNGTNLLDRRETCLIDIDKNNFEEDSDLEDDDDGFDDISTENACGEEGHVKIVKLKAEETVRPNYLSRQVCCIQNYSLVVSSSGGVYPQCLRCYYEHGINVPVGEHSFVSNHYKRRMGCCGQDLHCSVCEVNLFTLCPTNVCVFCNAGENKPMENHVFNKEILFSK